MFTTLDIVLSIVALALGAVAAYAFSRASRYKRELFGARIEIEAGKAHAEEHKDDLSKALDALRNEMKAETEQILKSRADELTKGNRTEMDRILSPIKESMDKMKQAMDENAREHVKSNTELKFKLEQAVKDMGERTADVGAKADNLSEALTGRPKVQGCWGEHYLEDILSREGLEEGTHYTREHANEDLSRPDFLFHFMENGERKDLVVDSKVSLTAYVDYVNAGESEKEARLKDHVKSIRKHIDELGAKEYAKKIDKSKAFADYVLMFMPIDYAYRVAVDEDNSLWQYAYSKGILIATEQTIIPFLKIIQLTWNRYRQDSNIQEITQAAEDMIERVGAFYDSYKSLGLRLKAVCKEYNAGIGKLEDGGYSITTSARKVMKIGARRKKGMEFTVPETKVYLNNEDENEDD